MTEALKPASSYAVMHKITRLLFAGFDKSNEPLWVDQVEEAMCYAEESSARGQALLFVCHGVAAQKKPVLAK